MVCPSCNKFPAYDTSTEPEVEINDCDAEPVKEEPTKAVAIVSGSVRIVLTSECCGEEMKEATFDISDLQVDIEKAVDCTCENWLEGIEAETDGAEIVDRSETSKPFTYKTGPKKGQTVDKPIPYRYQKRFYGASVPIAINCACGKQVGGTTFEYEVQASGMDELC